MSSEELPRERAPARPHCPFGRMLALVCQRLYRRPVLNVWAMVEKYPLECRADTARCLICKRLFRKHSDEELETCFKRQRDLLLVAVIWRMARPECPSCGKRILGHTQGQFMACMDKLPHAPKYPTDVKSAASHYSRTPQSDRTLVVPRTAMA